MVQRLANHKSKVTLRGASKEDVQSVYDAAAPRSRNTYNKRTNRPWTEFSDIKFKKEGDEYLGTFTVTRDGIKGNHQNDVKEMMRNAAIKEGVTVKSEITDAARVPLAQPEIPEEEQQEAK